MGDGNHLEREVVHGMIKLGGWAAGRLGGCGGTRVHSLIGSR